jgi:uncharacterized protein (DUF488 family)
MYEALSADGHRWSDAMANQRIYTVGYGGRHPDEFLELLRSHQITRIIDGRVRPAEASMGVYKKAKRPDRGIEGLLDRAGISYSHFLELGNLFRGLEDWEQRYRALIQAAGSSLLDRLREIDEPYCLLCAEKDVTNCHRGIIADAIAREGHSVVHL